MENYVVHKLTKAGLDYNTIQSIGRREASPKATLMIQSQKVYVTDGECDPVGYIPHTGQYKNARLIFYLEKGCVDFKVMDHINNQILYTGFANVYDGPMVDVKFELPKDPSVLLIKMKKPYPKPKYEPPNNNNEQPTHSIVIGQNAMLNNNNNIAIGQASTSTGHSIAIGHGVAFTDPSYSVIQGVIMELW